MGAHFALQLVEGLEAAALDELQAVHGSDLSRWQWGAAHQMRSEHRPFSRVKALAPWFELRAPVGGDTHTVNVSRVGLRPDSTTGELYLNEHAASLQRWQQLPQFGCNRIGRNQQTPATLFQWPCLYAGSQRRGK